MSREYAEGRIREALKQTKGNPTRARQQVIAWTYEDAKLLHALAQPHLTGIVAHAVGRVIHLQNAETEQEDISAVPEGIDMEPEAFGKEILKALQSGNTPMFGREGSTPPLRRGKASQSHIDALNQIASQSKTKGAD